MTDLKSIFHKKYSITREEAAALLKTSPEALEAFEAAYRENALAAGPTGNLFDEDASALRRAMKKGKEDPDGELKETLDALTERILEELEGQTELISYDRENGLQYTRPAGDEIPAVTNRDLASIPEHLRPQLTGRLAKVDLGGPPSCLSLLTLWKDCKTGKTAKKREAAYHLFRQGLDILDLDPVMYEMLGTNPNAAGHWFPALAEAARKQDFFRIPETKILKVPLPMLQLTRLDYGSLNAATLQIVDDYCMRVFGLDERKEYFVKTGTYSSKFDFRNARVHGAKEVRELGEYLLYIQHQACVAAGPLSSPCIYGMSTTNEWCVREYIKDAENNPCIYHGMPLHTEYRVFADFDADEILGIAPYWDPALMKQRLGHEKDSASVHKIHDYAIFLAHEETLMKRYRENKGLVLEKMKALVPEMNLSGQWSIDVMQNGDDFWIIDMALAANSALKECIPEGKLKAVEEDWIPALGEKEND